MGWCDLLRKGAKTREVKALAGAKFGVVMDTYRLSGWSGFVCPRPSPEVVLKCGFGGGDVFEESIGTSLPQQFHAVGDPLETQARGLFANHASIHGGSDSDGYGYDLWLWLKLWLRRRW